MPTDEQLKEQADKILTEVIDKNPKDKEMIEAQKRANKELLGHEGDYSPDKY